MGIRVFVVDDERKIQSSLADLLPALGDFKIVGTASSEAEANLWLDDHAGEWDLAIVDLLLDQGAGLSVVARCRLHSRHGKIAVFSGFASAGVSRRCTELGADVVLDKAKLPALLDFCRDLARNADSGVHRVREPAQ
jgi:DNA-binding NarL/FixJ family response regulator